MSDKEEVKLENSEGNCYVMKVNVPFKEYKKYVEWKLYCEKFNNNYYWNKMWSDHSVVLRFEGMISQLNDKIDELSIKIDKKNEVGCNGKDNE